jgi:hypothetical protein
MKTERIALALTVVNLAILAGQSARTAAAAPQQQEPQMLRGRGLEIVDERGRRRAQIVLIPASTTSKGEKYPETVLFRLIDQNGRPGVKIGTSPDGSGIGLAGDSERRDWNGVQILAADSAALVKLTNKDGRVQTIRP